MLDPADSPKLSWAGYLRKRMRGVAPGYSSALQYSTRDLWEPRGSLLVPCSSFLALCTSLLALCTSLLALHSFVVEMVVSVRVGGRRRMGWPDMLEQRDCPCKISGRSAGFRALEL